MGSCCIENTLMVAVTETVTNITEIVILPLSSEIKYLIPTSYKMDSLVAKMTNHFGNKMMMEANHIHNFHLQQRPPITFS